MCRQQQQCANNWHIVVCFLIDVFPIGARSRDSRSLRMTKDVLLSPCRTHGRRALEEGRRWLCRTQGPLWATPRQGPEVVRAWQSGQCDRDVEGRGHVKAV